MGEGCTAERINFYILKILLKILVQTIPGVHEEIIFIGEFSVRKGVLQIGFYRYATPSGSSSTFEEIILYPENPANPVNPGSDYFIYNNFLLCVNPSDCILYTYTPLGRPEALNSMLYSPAGFSWSINFTISLPNAS
jgi:hypothetical protein